MTHTYISKAPVNLLLDWRCLNINRQPPLSKPEQIKLLQRQALYCSYILETGSETTDVSLISRDSPAPETAHQRQSRLCKTLMGHLFAYSLIMVDFCNSRACRSELATAYRPGETHSERVVCDAGFGVQPLSEITDDDVSLRRWDHVKRDDRAL